MLKAMSATVLLTFGIGAFATESLEGFKKRFDLVRDQQGEVKFVKMKLASSKFTVQPLIEQVKSDIRAEITRLQSKSFDTQLDELAIELGSHDKNTETVENVEVIRRSLERLKSLNVRELLNDLDKSDVLSQFSLDMEAALKENGLTTIASVDDTRYFYKRAVVYEVVKKALEYAKKQLGDVPVLNIVSHIIVQVHDMIMEQRITHQNMFLFYLENVGEDKLGISVHSADRIFSSIYESRISAINYIESNRATENWASYGLNKFYTMVRMANNKLRRSLPSFDKAPARLNFGFVDVVEGGHRVIKNLIHTKHSFSQDMAIAYDYSDPQKVKRLRSLLNLGELALGFVTVPGWLKEQVVSFMRSYYVEQKKLEGSLIGYFEYTGDVKMAKQIKAGLINPYFQ